MLNNDLISRAEAIAEVEQWAKHGYDVIHWTGIKAMLETQPAIDAAPVAHGTWGRYYDGDHCTEYIVCQNCGAKYDSDIVFAYHNGETRLELEGLEHCPHCGALLDGGEPMEWYHKRTVVKLTKK